MDTLKKGANKGVKLLQTETDPSLSTAELMLTNSDLQPGVISFILSLPLSI